MTLLPQTPHGSILLLNSSPSDPPTITFVLLVLTFKPLLSSASFKFQNLCFKSTLVSLLRTKSSAYSTSLITLFLAFSVITSTTTANNSSDSTDLSWTPTFTSNSSEYADSTLTLVFAHHTSLSLPKPLLLMAHSITFLGTLSKLFPCQQNTNTIPFPSFIILLHSSYKEYRIYCFFSWHKSKLHFIQMN